MSPQRGFTLAEMLIVVAVLAILGTVTLVALNPFQLLAQQRDSNRMSDLSSLSIAIQDYASVVGGSLGSANTLYVSIPDPMATSTAGDQCQGLGLPALTGYTYHCAASSTYRNIDGTGWVPVNFRAIGSVLPISSLPLDPTNTTSSHFYYMYATNGTKFEVTAAMESAKYKLGGASDAISSDGGPLASVYEKGTQFGLEPLDYGDASLVGYWPLNEGTGTIAIDNSGNNATGSWAGTTPYYTTGMIGGYAGNFNGSNDRVNVGNGASLNTGNTFTLAAWIKPTAGSSRYGIFTTRYSNNNGSWQVEEGASGVGGCGNNSIAVTGVSTWMAISSANTITLNAWNQVVVVKNGTSANSVTIYINGLPATLCTSAAYTVSDNAASKYIGEGTSASQFFRGAIDDVRYYNRALSAGEIQALYSGIK